MTDHMVQVVVRVVLFSMGGCVGLILGYLMGFTIAMNRYRRIFEDEEDRQDIEAARLAMLEPGFIPLREVKEKLGL